MFDIVEYLTSKNLNPKPASEGNVRCLCPFHEEEPNKPGRLYIQVEDEEKYGLLWCFVCGQRGTINKLRKFFGDAPIEMAPSEFSNPIIEVAAQYYHERLFENVKEYLYLEDRGLEESTIIQARLGYADGGLATHLLNKGYAPEEIRESGLVRLDGTDYFKDEIIFPCLKYGRAIQLRGKKSKSMKGVQTPLYNSDSIIGEDIVCITEGEIDCLTMQQMGFNTVGVPGVQTWKDEWTDLLADSKRIYIVFDQDKAGIAGAEKTASKLGPRSRIVELPKKGIDVNDWYVKYDKRREDFEYLFQKAKGGLLVTVHQAFDKWTEVEGNANLVGLKFNIGPIDRAIPQGLLPGYVMSLISRTGGGKTIFAVNMMHRMKMLNPEFKCLFISLEQTRNEWFERAHRIHNFYNPGATVMDTMDYWKNNILMVDKNRVSEDQLIDCIEQYTYDAGRPADLVIVDYLGYYARAFSGNAKEQTSEAIMGLKRIAKEFETVIFAPHQANRTGELGKRLQMDMAKDAATVEETSDLMFGLYKPELANPDNKDDIGRVYLEILKSRQGGVGTEMYFHFAPLTLAMVPSDDKLYDEALRERSFALAGDTWCEAVNRRLTGNIYV